MAEETNFCCLSDRLLHVCKNCMLITDIVDLSKFRRKLSGRFNFRLTGVDNFLKILNKDVLQRVPSNEAIYGN